MKLSEAIRLGSVLHPQAFGALSEGIWRPVARLIGEIVLERSWETTATCALGAAYAAIGKLAMGEEEHDREAFPELALIASCPVQGCTAPEAAAGLLHGLIPHLNDEHEWSREEIADFVEGVEIATEVEGAVICEEVCAE